MSAETDFDQLIFEDALEEFEESRVVRSSPNPLATPVGVHACMLVDRRTVNRRQNEQWDAWVAGNWAVVYFLHTNICCGLLHTINCTHIDGQSRLLMDSEVIYDPTPNPLPEPWPPCR